MWAAGYFPTHLVAKTKCVPETAEPGAASRLGSDGILLGTTVAISGAGADPGQGYYNSRAAAFLMTVLNVRLGWWLGNPAGLKASASHFRPRLHAGRVVRNHHLPRALSSTSRCRYIIVCDAEQDQDLAFGGISTAIRMCRTDFGAEIRIDLSQIERKPDNKPENFSGCHYAIGAIGYAEGTTGTLVYLKSSLTGDEPADVLGYHNQVPLFPHESTADQWSDESQFESYRALGYHIANEALAPIGKAASRHDFFGP
ncbi:hypothetical protein SBA4_3440008 [Candidatus Sulfopaludibacter sp. SbA4]|nr:hypothetical protein SBA4_3440008 [Candidatus Sulfopaludibacter sp. SbA4]